LVFEAEKKIKKVIIIIEVDEQENQTPDSFFPNSFEDADISGGCSIARPSEVKKPISL
jgi:hypothetical protein